MAHYTASESKRVQFRRYLEQSGVLDSLTNVLVTLYEEPDKPNNALDFMKRQLGASDGELAEAEALRAELSELQHKYDMLVQENKDLRQRRLSEELNEEEERAAE